jgi:AraC-like DNA-binding protein
MDNLNIPMDPILIRKFGLIHRSPLHSTAGTKEQDIMMCVFTEGTGYYKNKQINTKIEGGVIAFFLPSDPGVLYADSKKPYSHYFCRFNGSFAFEVVNRIIKFWNGQIIKSEKYSDIVLILKKMRQEFRKDLRKEMIAQEGVLLQILLLLLDTSLVLEKNERYFNMVHYLENKVDQTLNVAQMAKSFHLSVGHLNRIFKQGAGMSIGQFHEITKINLSKTLLENSTLPIKEIAKRVGYQDALYFSRVFKKQTNISPNEWRKKKAED